MDYTVHEILQARILEGIFPTQGSNPGLPTLEVESLPAKPQGNKAGLSVISIPKDNIGKKNIDSS